MTQNLAILTMKLLLPPVFIIYLMIGSVRNVGRQKNNLKKFKIIEKR
ncbi:hypothetical protein KsCSTR_04450 [Candidatus Kuenenia stuttgartiensis]|nr:hypothetical protein KsCSTR_04450 [Candidatus Kuenenia stuttgartiensis]